MKRMNKKKIKRLELRRGYAAHLFWGSLIIVGLLVSSSIALATQYQLVETIDMTGYSILDIGSDGSNLLILDNGSPDKVKIINPSGGLINSFNTPSNFNSGITYNGSEIIFGNGSDTVNTYLREMNPLNGSTSGPVSPNLGSLMGLGFDGTNILASYYATGSGGVLTENITKLNASTYASVGTISVTVDTGTAISSTPVRGVGWHNNNLFLGFQGVNIVYQFDADFNLIEEIPVITSIGPRGIAFVGDDLFVADRDAQKIYRYAPVSHRCGNGVLESGEQCDDGNTVNGDCCSATCSYEPAGADCGDESDTICDNPDSCDGSGGCQINNEPGTTVCRADAGECDVAEFCDGAGACPPDGKSTSECRTSAGDCDVAEVCDGASNDCPADNYKPDTTPCDDGDFCTEGETCTAGICGGGSVPDEVCDGMGVIVPAYFYPSWWDLEVNFWDDLIVAAQQIPVIAIMNPNSGPGDSQNSDYVHEVDALRQVGGEVIGYVHTSYGNRPIDDCKDEVDKYYDWYNVDGIFFDEMSNDPGAFDYYKELYDYVVCQGGIVVGNPGTNTDELYMDAATILVVSEGHGDNYPGWSPASWIGNYPPSSFSNMVYGVSDESVLENDIDSARDRNVGWIYITDDVLENPWDTLPGYWEQFIELCKGKDNNCDGEINEGFNFGELCTVGEENCQTDGFIMCSADGLSTDCGGYDNNCDGEIDEGCEPGCDSELTSGLTALYHMNGDWNDASGNGNNGTRSGSGTEFNVTDPKLGNASGEFNGSDDLVVIDSNNMITGSSPRTIAFWAKIDNDTGNYGAVFTCYGTGTYKQAFSLGFARSGRAGITQRSFNFAAWYSDLLGTNPIYLNRWHHYVVTYDGTTLSMYLDGSLDNSAAMSNLNTANTPINIGWTTADDGNWGHIDGSIDEFGIWGRALSAGEVADLFNSGAGRQIPTDADDDGYYSEGGCTDEDCDDADAQINPEADEVCDDDIDNDCDGKTDAADEDCWECEPQTTQPCQTGQPGECAVGAETCSETGTWGSCIAPGPGTEVGNCNDQLDNDCDGKIDTADEECWECEPQTTQPCQTGQPGECAVGAETCSETGTWGSCIAPGPGTEVGNCNDQLDNDCDGKTDAADEECWECEPQTTQPCQTGQPGECAVGAETCSETGSWGSCVAPEPGTEDCSDGLDNDCDGKIDAADEECSGGGGCNDLAEDLQKADINDDCCVDKDDLAIVLKALGRRKGTPDVGSNFNADANGDGNVDKADIVYVSRRMGNCGHSYPRGKGKGNSKSYKK